MIHVPASCFRLCEDGPFPWEKAFRNDISNEDAERRWFAGLMWRAFPDSRSENELAERVAAHLSGEGRDIHPRTVHNWLRCENTPHFRYVLNIIALVGANGRGRG